MPPPTLCPRARAFLAGAAVTLLIAASVAAFLAYQHPALLLQYLNLNYCS